MTPILTRSLTPNPPGVKVARFLRGLVFGAEHVRQAHPDTPEVGYSVDLIEKAAVGPMLAGENVDLVESGIIDAQASLLLAGQSAVEAALARARRVPFAVAIPREGAGTAGGWVLEGGGKVVTSYAFDTIKLTPTALASLYVCSTELLRLGAAEQVIARAALGAQGRAETDAFLNPAYSAVGTAPASITFGQPVVTSTGSMSADLTSMISAITTSGAGLTWFMRPGDLAAIAAALGGSAVGLPDSLLGLPVVTLPSMSAGSVVLVDLNEIVIGASPLQIAKSEQSVVEMESAPTMHLHGGSPAGPVPTTAVSLWQSDSACFRLSRYLSWAIARDVAVCTMVLNFGSPA